MYENRELAFFNLAAYTDEQRKVTCKWYEKQKETETILKFCNCSPLLHKIFL